LLESSCLTSSKTIRLADCRSSKNSLTASDGEAADQGDVGPVEQISDRILPEEQSTLKQEKHSLLADVEREQKAEQDDQLDDEIVSDLPQVVRVKASSAVIS
jgi:hypothetical protein